MKTKKEVKTGKAGGGEVSSLLDGYVAVEALPDCYVIQI